MKRRRVTGCREGWLEPELDACDHLGPLDGTNDVTLGDGVLVDWIRESATVLATLTK